jgi:hypothetical protein
MSIDPALPDAHIVGRVFRVFPVMRRGVSGGRRDASSRGGERVSLKDRGSWFLSWLAPVSWLVVAVLLVLYVGTPAVRLEAPTLAWVVTLAIVVFALTHTAARGQGSLSRARGHHELRAPFGGAGAPRGARGRGPHASTWYKGRSHSGARPRFD